MDDARKRILERRARFVAAAIATLGSSCSRPQPCLSAVPLQEHDAATPTKAAESPDAGAPVPCLEIEPPPSAAPAICLSPMPPRKTDAG
jgi:hypothetical protein